MTARQPTKPRGTLTLDEFLSAERARLDDFEAMWRRYLQIDPAHWPAEMLPGEWDEQLECWRKP